jgi:hypothetical protein
MDAPIARMHARMCEIVERFIGASERVGQRRPPMNCVVERALAASHAVAGDYGDFSVMRKR